MLACQQQWLDIQLGCHHFYPSFVIRAREKRSGNGARQRQDYSHLASFMLSSHSNHRALIIHVSKPAKQKPIDASWSAPFRESSRFILLHRIYGMFRDLLYRCPDTLLLKDALDFTPCRLQQHAGLCAVLYCKLSEQMSQKRSNIPM